MPKEGEISDRLAQELADLTVGFGVPTKTEIELTLDKLFADQKAHATAYNLATQKRRRAELRNSRKLSRTLQEQEIAADIKVEGLRVTLELTEAHRIIFACTDPTERTGFYGSYKDPRSLSSEDLRPEYIWQIRQIIHEQRLEIFLDTLANSNSLDAESPNYSPLVNLLDFRYYLVSGQEATSAVALCRRELANIPRDLLAGSPRLNFIPGVYTQEPEQASQ